MRPPDLARIECGRRRAEPTADRETMAIPCNSQAFRKYLGVTKRRANERFPTARGGLEDVTGEGDWAHRANELDGLY
jgi:hypothetical protein